MWIVEEKYWEINKCPYDLGLSEIIREKHEVVYRGNIREINEIDCRENVRET